MQEAPPPRAIRRGPSARFRRRASDDKGHRASNPPRRNSSMFGGRTSDRQRLGTMSPRNEFTGVATIALALASFFATGARATQPPPSTPPGFIPPPSVQLERLAHQGRPQPEYPITGVGPEIPLNPASSTLRLRLRHSRRQLNRCRSTHASSTQSHYSHMHHLEASESLCLSNDTVRDARLRTAPVGREPARLPV
jgi:hypothetical protein